MKFGDLKTEASLGAEAMERSGGAIQALGQHGPDAARSVGEISRGFGDGAPAVGEFAGHMETTDEKLSKLVAGSPWRISVIADGEDPPPPPGCCFTAGTKIAMADGTYNKIEDVAIGDLVLSYDIESGQIIPSVVLELSSPFRDHYYIMSFESGESLNLTGDHPVRIIKSGTEVWGAINPAASSVTNILIEPGDVAVALGGYRRITTIRKVPGRIKTYNLSNVKDTHTFFAEGVVVHNELDKCGSSFSPRFPIPLPPGGGDYVERQRASGGSAVIIETLNVYANGSGDVGDAVYRDLSAKLKLLRA